MPPAAAPCTTTSLSVSVSSPSPVSSSSSSASLDEDEEELNSFFKSAGKEKVSGDFSDSAASSAERRRSSLRTCDECGFVCESEKRFEEHFKEPRHVYHYRSMAYREPLKRQMWLKIWFSELEAAEEQNRPAFEVDESEEDAFLEALRRQQEAASARREKTATMAEKSTRLRQTSTTYKSYSSSTWRYGASTSWFS